MIRPTSPQPNVGLVEAPGESGCPSGMVPVTASFCVDRYEASLVEVLADGSTTEWSPYHNPGAHRVRALSREGAVPQAYMDGVHAAAACEEAGKRLCTDTEWLRACQGSASFTYPYGNTRRTGVCNDHRDVHPAVERFGTSADWIWSALGDACIDQLPMSLATAGAYAGCVSESGAMDMMGNLHEWTADPAGTFRGGFYVDTVINGNGCLYRTTAHDMGHWDYSTGFRCCADR
ncbi:MAG: SUMF1/EgtB/PvdO family nonheme iron enzyme [Sandaracinus sp.]